MIRMDLDSVKLGITSLSADEQWVFVEEILLFLLQSLKIK